MPEVNADAIVEKATSQLQTRLDELDAQITPLTSEREKIQTVLSNFNGRPRTTTRSTGTRRRRGGSNNRSGQFLQAIIDHPGSTVSELGEFINADLPEDDRVQGQYFYRVKKLLLKDGKIIEDANKKLRVADGVTADAAA